MKLLVTNLMFFCQCLAHESGVKGEPGPPGQRVSSMFKFTGCSQVVLHMPCYMLDITDLSENV